jgi:hypothetical protein
MSSRVTIERWAGWSQPIPRSHKERSSRTHVSSPPKLRLFGVTCFSTAKEV